MRTITLGVCAAMIIATVMAAEAADSWQSEGNPQSPVGQAVALISGTVVADEASGTRVPVRRARVTLRSTEGTVGRTVTTDDAGRFEFGDLPAGRYVLEAHKGGWLRTAFGARRPGRPGTAVVLAGGELVRELELKMMRGGAIAGTIRDDRGMPAPNIAVGALLSVWRDGERVLEPPALTAMTYTDNAGAFRVFGLPPGDYTVLATPRLTPSQRPADYQPLSSADVDRILQSGTARAAAGLQPGLNRPAGSTSLVTHAPVAFPGATDPAHGSRVVLGPGEERLGIDMTLPLVSTARVEGVVTGPDGAPRPRAAVVLVWSGQPIRGNLQFINSPNTQSDGAGRYRLEAVLPGTYTLLAAAPLNPPPPPAPGAVAHDMHGEGPMLWAQQEVHIVGGEREIPLALQLSMNVRGRVKFETQGAPPDFVTLRVFLAPVGSAVSLTGSLDAVVDARDGAFQILGVAPGRYMISIVPPGPSTVSRWVAKSSVARGQDSLDLPVEIRAGDSIDEWVLTLTDRPSELTGTLSNAAGRPESDHSIVVFAADRAFWTPSSRRIVAARPAADGTFSFRGLPAGDYFMATVADVEPGEWLSPAFLDPLVGSAVRVTIIDGQKTVQSMKLAGG